MYNPNLNDAKEHLICRSNQTPDQAWAHEQEWLAGKIIGDPKATDDYSVAQLRAMNLVGIYVLEE